MDIRLYKKKDLAFTNNEASRMSRHAETLKARESSRFKRLSLLRNIDEEVDEEQSIKIVKREEKKKPQSRLEMLFKWKQEKQMKKNLDKNKSKKPFYVGSQLKQTNSNMSSSVPQPKGVSLFSSRIANSRLVPPSSTQPAKIVSTTKQVSSSSTQPAKIMNTAKQQTKGTTFQSSKIPNNFKPIGAKTANVTKSNGGLSKISKAFGNATVSSTTQGSLPRIAQSTKTQVAKGALNTRSGVAKPLAVKSQVSALPKPTLVKQPTKPLSKTGIPSFPSNSVKGNSAQNINRKPVITPVSKVHEKATPHSTENVSNKKKENCLKTTFTKLPARKNEASNSTSKKKSEERNNAKEELIPQLHLDSASSIFDCDISVIKCTPSFAPANFKFVPPTGLPNLSIDDEVFERIKEKVSRTSTPSKELKKSSSPAVKVASNNSSLINSAMDMSTNLLVEEILQKETDANLPRGTENYLPNEQKNVPILVNESTDFLAKVDLKNIERLFEEHKKLEEEGAESNSGEICSENRADNKQKLTINDVPNEQKNASVLVNEFTDFLAKVDLKKIERLFEEYKRTEAEGAESNSGNVLIDENKSAESAKALEDVSIDSALSIVDLSDSEDICTKPLELLKLENEPISDKGERKEEASKKESNQSTKTSEDVCVDSPLQLIDLNKIKNNSTNHELDILESEELIKDKALNKKESNQKRAVTKDTRVDSPLKIIDLNKYEKIAANNELEVLEEEDDLINVDDLCNQQDQDKYIKKKLDVHSKRSSMFKKVPILNSITEVAEHEDCSFQIPNVYSKNKETATPSRHSQRLQQLVTLEENSPSICAGTPRRSLRLQNKVAEKCDFEEPILSPKPKSNLRRSIRLIDLNTPEKEIVNTPVSKTNITVDFQRLTLEEPENINPHACLLDFDCSPVIKAQPRKISLLYSPEKGRKSMRRSIRGDLMSFSPSN